MESDEPRTRGIGRKLIDNMFVKTKAFFEATPDSEL
jgi:hypothetical protein